MQIQDRNRQRKTVIVLAVLSAVLQLTFAHVIGLAGGHPNFAFVFAACISLMFGGTFGVVSGFAAGLFFDLTTTGPMGLMSLLLTVCSFVLGSHVRNNFAENPQVAYAQGGIAAFFVSLVYSLAMLFTGDATSIVDVIFFRALPTALLTFVVYLPFALVLSHRSRPARSLGSSIGRTLGSHRGGRGL